MVSSFEAQSQLKDVLINYMFFSSEIVMGILRRVVKAPSPNLPSILVQMNPLLDVLSALGNFFLYF